MDYEKYIKAKPLYWAKRATSKHINYVEGSLLFVKFGVLKPTGLVDGGFTDWATDLTYEELSFHNEKVIYDLKCNK